MCIGYLSFLKYNILSIISLREIHWNVTSLLLLTSCHLMMNLHTKISFFEKFCIMHVNCLYLSKPMNCYTMFVRIININKTQCLFVFQTLPWIFNCKFCFIIGFVKFIKYVHCTVICVAPGVKCEIVWKIDHYFESCIHYHSLVWFYFVLVILLHYCHDCIIVTKQ